MPWRTMLIGAATLMLLTAGCAGPAHDPGGFVVLNASGALLTELTVREVTDDPLSMQRLGRFGNVPPDSVQYVYREENAPPLPEALVVAWRARDHAAHEQTVDLREVMDAAGPVGRDAFILIEIGPEATLSVSVGDG